MSHGQDKEKSDNAAVAVYKAVILILRNIGYAIIFTCANCRDILGMHAVHMCV